MATSDYLAEWLEKRNASPQPIEYRGTRFLAIASASPATVPGNGLVSPAVDQKRDKQREKGDKFASRPESCVTGVLPDLQFRRTQWLVE